MADNANDDIMIDIDGEPGAPLNQVSSRRLACREI